MDENWLLKRIRTLTQKSGTAQGGLYAPGDDCALIAPKPGHVLAISTDIYQVGVHFPPQLDVAATAWHCLVGAISDLAAVGAKPLAMTLALSAEDALWIDALLPHCLAVCEAYDMQLMGGDLSQGPISLCATVIGQTQASSALSRAQARPQDDIWVSGYPGEAAAGLNILMAQTKPQSPRPQPNTTPPDWAKIELRLIERFSKPDARIALGIALQGVAHAAIDISDGLLTDLNKLLQASHCGAIIDPDVLPISSALDAYARMQQQDALHWVCAGGDDYELCFTASVTERDQIEAIAKRLDLKLGLIGSVVAGQGLHDPKGAQLSFAAGWQHFAAKS